MNIVLYQDFIHEGKSSDILPLYLLTITIFTQ